MTKIKTIESMTTEEKSKLILKNTQLQNSVSDRLQESENDYIADILYALNLKNYSIDLYSYSYVKFFDDFDKVREGIENAYNNFDFFGDVEWKEYKKLDEKIEKYNSVEMYSEEYNQLEDEIKEDLVYFEDYIVKSLKSIYEFWEVVENVQEEFIHDSWEMYSDYYIKDDDYSVIYRMQEISI